MVTSKEVFKLAYPNLYKVLAELMLVIPGGELLREFSLPEYLVGNLGKLEDLARATRFLMPTLHGGAHKEDWSEACQVLAYGQMEDQVALLNNKPELYLLFLFLNDVFQGNLNEVFIQQRQQEEVQEAYTGPMEPPQ